MGKALTELNKSKNKGIFFPNELATYFVDEYTPYQSINVINGYYNNMVINYDEVKEINKKISSNQKKYENTTTSIKSKQETALVSFIATSISYQEVKLNEGVKAEWLASDSDNPSSDHMDNYGKIFYLDEGIDGEIPAERPNCRCGFRIIKE